MRPDVTIITPTLNAGKYLADLCESLRSSEGPVIEHLVVDGGSSDDTVDIARRFGCRVIVAQGSGITDAINRGVAASQGEGLVWANADDYMAPGGVRALWSVLVADPLADVAYGRMTILLPDGQRIDGANRVPNQFRLALYGIEGMASVNAAMFRREALVRLGPLDTRYRYIADLELNKRLGLSRARAIFIDREVYVFRRHAGSLTSGDHLTQLPNFLKFQAERLRLYSKLLVGNDGDWLLRVANTMALAETLASMTKALTKSSLSAVTSGRCA